MAEDLYSRLPGPVESQGAAQRSIRLIRQFIEALDAAEAAYQAYELYPKTYRSGRDLVVRADFDAVTRPESEYKARDHVAGSTRLREVMGL